MKPTRAKRRITQKRGLEAIAIFKLAKGVILLAVGTGAITLLHSDIGNLATRWVEALRFDPDNRHIHWVLAKLMAVDDRTLKELSAGTFFYATLLLTEGIGLLREKIWAEYLTVSATSLFIPVELYELGKHLTPGRVILCGVNIAVVCYLIALLRRKRESQPAVAIASQR